MTEIILIKLGGSLITDKRREETPRNSVIERLALEMRRLAEERPSGLILGHGSGSYGHAVARRYGLGPSKNARNLPAAAAATQDAAARLHRKVVAALIAAGAAPFSVVPSSVVTADGDRPVTFDVRAVEMALKHGLQPILYGDVVLDRQRGATILSTETIFVALAEQLVERGHQVERAFWLGETQGVYDHRREVLRELSPAGAKKALEVARRAEGIDVTGGMRHRVEAALRLAEMGVTSWILDGREPGVLGRALAGEAGLGTIVGPDR
jgi:isopentenyl phosphate kinase